MPRRKQTACNPRKPRLVFLESPQAGHLHEYGAHPQKTDPIQVPTKPLDHNASTSWVSPQFDQAAQLHFPARRRPQHTSINSTLHDGTRDTSRGQKRGAAKKASVCNFPSLSFTSETAEKTRRKSVCVRRKPALQVCTEGKARLSPILQESLHGKALSPPDIRTPDVSLECEPSARLEDETRTPRSRARAERDAVPETPQVAGPGQVLAEDTPEHEYGLRITWRRRKPLMRYLKERGKLQISQTLVKQ
ncbi:RAD9, HUS1, RAD1-interacting nuclear orphan protein 1 [Spea bombifrons]|uniref:RAD9, HUS1, RAD1-interacting nuclear orphan protein 1 n=1 Tax=Spea bombifrons TaxID=233779 RepID=UPI00234A52FA|nr:RAD9, HUS1, RAD1-interacting nuclear orphan protein 1 [Spea bombifrons]XP_053318713.1 RAD9, HUS1, RAD1-interacting nuclear orphan protein 1 [Spea bombifrons]